jgi:uncharacterized protein
VSITLFTAQWIEAQSLCIKRERMMKRLTLMVAGWVLLVVGAAGLFLPILPGVLLVLVALSILSVEYAWARRWVSALKRRFPSAERKLQTMFSRR